MRKMHDPAGAASLAVPVDSEWRGPYHSHCPSRWCRCSQRRHRPLAPNLPAFFESATKGGVSSLAIMGPNLAVTSGQNLHRGPLNWGTHSTPAWSPISACKSGTGTGERPRFRTNRGRGRGSVPAPGQIIGTKVPGRPRPRANRGRRGRGRGRPGVSAPWKLWSLKPTSESDPCYFGEFGCYLHRNRGRPLRTSAPPVTVGTRFQISNRGVCAQQAAQQPN
jgi:hypothetical protein